MTSELVESYTSDAPLSHRKKHGQFFTPREVSDFMCNWVLGNNAKELFDPAFGLGVFYASAMALDNNIHFTGYDVDCNILDSFNNRYHSCDRLKLVFTDYFERWDEEHESIVCNPPYNRFQNFLNRHVVFNKLARKHGIKLSGYTNIASAFLVKSLMELKEGGRLAYIMPLEFLNTGYGEVIKKLLIDSDSLRALIKLDDERGIFPDATTSVGIILVEKSVSAGSIDFFSLKSSEELSSCLLEPVKSIPTRELDPNKKWLSYFSSDKSVADVSNLVRLDTYGRFSRGVATGANEFFVLNKKESDSLCLPAESLSVCVSKSSYIKSNVFTADDLTSLLITGKNVFLFEAEKCINSVSVQQYLDYGVSKGYNQRYLTRTRSPWYKVEHRSPAPLLFGVFSRGGFKVVRNLTDAVSLTCFHCFYPNSKYIDYVDHLFLYFMSSAAKKILSTSMRTYGDKLDKFEPNDLNSALVPSVDWFSTLDRHVVLKALDDIHSGLEISQELDLAFSKLVTENEKEFVRQNNPNTHPITPLYLPHKPR